MLVKELMERQTMDSISVGRSPKRTAKMLARQFLEVARQNSDGTLGGIKQVATAMADNFNEFVQRTIETEAGMVPDEKRQRITTSYKNI